MSSQLELAVEERALAGGEVRRLRDQGIIPGNMYGRNQPSVALQVSAAALQKLLDHGGSRVILSLKVGDRPAVQALIKEIQHNGRNGRIQHVDFHLVAATEKLRTSVQLRFVNEASASRLGDLSVARPLGEVMVECLPADLPSTIEVDLSELTEMGAVIRVGNLAVGPGVVILTDANEMVAGMQQQFSAKKAEDAEGKAGSTASAPEAPGAGGAGRP